MTFEDGIKAALLWVHSPQALAGSDLGRACYDAWEDMGTGLDGARLTQAAGDLQKAAGDLQKAEDGLVCDVPIG